MNTDSANVSAPLVAMPTSRPSLDQVIQVIGGERSGEFAPAYMPEYSGLRAIAAPMMYAPPQFAAPAQQAPQFTAPVQQAPVPQETVTRSAGRTFTPFTVPERAPVTAPPKDIYSGKPVITNAPIIGFTAAGDPIYANIPEIESKEPGGPKLGGAIKNVIMPSENDPSYLRNPVIGYTQNGLPIYASTSQGYQPKYVESYNKEGGLIALAKGGSVAQEAKGLAALGRGGDTMLVHMAPEEVSGLRALALQNGTDLTINPDTGLPEAKRLKKLLRAVAPILPFVIPGAGTLLGGLAGQALASGIIGGFAAPGKGFNFKEGLKTGATAYAMGSLYNYQAGVPSGSAIGPGNQAAAGGAGGTSSAAGGAGGSSAVTSANVSPTVGVDNVAFGNEAAYTYYGAPPATAPTTAPVVVDPIAASPPPEAFGAGPGPSVTDAGVGGTQVGVSDPSLTSNPAGASTQASSSTVAGAEGKKVTGFEEKFGVSPTTALIGGSMGLSAYQADKEMDMYKAAQARQLEEEERKRREGEATFQRSLGRVPVYSAGGGLVALARGGMTYMEAGGTTGPTGEPRMVAGTGDGMSDSVPATIEGVQEARLANDEFVIPADVVADIGNGSSSSGAKKLYDMMDRIRKARHGTTEQPPEIRAEKYMPA
jgi:hypothetical protein